MNRFYYWWRDTPKWLLPVPIVVLFLSLLLVSIIHVGEQNSQLHSSWPQPNLHLVQDIYGAFCLSVRSPTQLRLLNTLPRSIPLTVNVFPLSKSETISSTLHLTSTRQALHSRVWCGSTSYEIEHQGQAITNTGTTSYLISLTNVTPLDGLEVHANGRIVDRVEQEIVVGQGLSIVSTPPLLVAQSSRSNYFWQSYSFQIQIYREGEAQEIYSTILSMPVENNLSAIIRHLGQAFAQHIVAIWIALLPIYVAVFTAELRKRQERRQDCHQDCLAEIDTVAEIRRRDSVEFVNTMKEIEIKINAVSSRSDNCWRDEEVRTAWKRKIQDLVEPEFDILLKMFAGVDSTIAKDKKRDALAWVIFDSDLSVGHQEQAAKLLQKIDPAYLDEIVDRTYGSALLRAWSVAPFPPRSPSFISNIPWLSSINSFAHLQAENDSLLFRIQDVNVKLGRRVLMFRPSWYRDWLEKHLEPTTERRISYVTGKDGSGKTAAALQTGYRLWMETASKYVAQGGALPLYWSFKPVSDNVTEHIRAFVNVYTRSIGVYCATRPQAFLNSSVRQQKSLAYLFSQCIGRVPELDLFLHQHRLQESELPDAFLSTLHKHLQQIDQSRSLHELGCEELLRYVSHALPVVFSNLISLIDVQHEDELGSVESRRVQQVVDIIARVSTQVHVFLPPISENGQTFKGAAQKTIQWERQDLKQILEDRLVALDENASKSLGILCDPREGVDIQEATTRVIDASKGSPKRLLFIGQQFIARIEEQGRKLTQEDIDAILGSIDDNPHGH